MANNTMLSGVIALAAGAGGVLASEFAGHHSLRILAALLLVAGAIALGIARSAVLRPASSGGRKSLMHALACLIAVLLSAPPLLLFLTALAAAYRRYTTSADPALITAGGAIAFLLLVILIAALAIGVYALCSREQAREDQA